MPSTDRDRSKSGGCFVLPGTKCPENAEAQERGGSRYSVRGERDLAAAPGQMSPGVQSDPARRDGSIRTAGPQGTGVEEMSSNTTAWDRPHSPASLESVNYSRRTSAGRRYGGALHVRANKLHDLVHRCARLENRRHARLLESINILIRDDPAYQHDYVIHLVALEQVHYARHDRIVGARENR